MCVRPLMVILAMLIGYGSIFPFDYVAHQPGWQDLRRLFAAWPAHLSASDVIGNMLLFVPLGFMIPLLSNRLRDQLGWTVLAIGYAWVLQYLQFWYPSRDPVGSDAVFNNIGLLFGLLTAAALKPALHHLAHQFDRGDRQWPALLGLLLLWLAYRWFPLVPTLDVGELKNALKPLLLYPTWDAARVLHDVAAWSLWFWLARHGPVRLLQSPRVAVLAALAVLAAEPLFIGGSISLSNALGLAVALLLQRGAFWSISTRSKGTVEAGVAALLAASIVVSELAPFTFNASNRFLWLPFAGMLSGSMVLNTASLIEKCYLYGGLLLLLARCGIEWRMSACLFAAGLGVLEGLQTRLPGRTPESTDALLALLLAIALQVLASSDLTWSAPTDSRLPAA